MKISSFFALLFGILVVQNLSAQRVFKDCPACPDMVAIPAGSFLMGMPEPSSDPFDENLASFGHEWNRPQHRVSVKAFAMGKYEVTQEQWHAVMGDNPSYHKGRRGPVERVDWDTVQNFIDKLNKITGKKYRLPSEAEWEYAARAGTTSYWSFGNDRAKLQDHAWYNYDRYQDTRIHPVGEKPANRFGLHDMYGNVSEWTQDCWHDSYVGAPTDGSAWQSSCDEEDYRAVRGGSSYEPYFFVPSSAWRSRDSFTVKSQMTGFRLARDLFNTDTAVKAAPDRERTESKAEGERRRKELEENIRKIAKESESKEPVVDQGNRSSQKPAAESPEVREDTTVVKISDKFAASIEAAIRPNITFDANTVTGNPEVEILVVLTPDGTIIDASIVKTSGVRFWDGAVLRALAKTERLPKDGNGRVPPTLIISMRPKNR
jgi:TonB family protein